MKIYDAPSFAGRLTVRDGFDWTRAERELRAAPNHNRAVEVDFRDLQARARVAPVQCRTRPIRATSPVDTPSWRSAFMCGLGTAVAVIGLLTVAHLRSPDASVSVDNSVQTAVSAEALGTVY